MKTIPMLSICLFFGLYSCGTNKSEIKNLNKDSITNPEKIPGLIAFWDFQEAAGTNRVAKNNINFALEEMNGPIKSAEDGIFGPYCADFNWGQWFRLKRENTAGLNLHGDGQHISMIIWIKLESDRPWQYIAGVWSEGDKRFIGKSHGTGERAPARQYAMFINGTWQNDYTTYERIKAKNQAHGYISSTGGATPDCSAAFDYATGKTNLDKDRWYMLAYTYDGKWIKVYVDGELDANNTYNPFSYKGPIYDGGENGADFTVAQRNHPQWPTYPEGLPTFEEGFDGKIGGLAVYDRALDNYEIYNLYKGTMY